MNFATLVFIIIQTVYSFTAVIAEGTCEQLPGDIAKSGQCPCKPNILGEETKPCCGSNNVVNVELKPCCQNNNVVNVEPKPCCQNNNVVNVGSKPCCQNNNVVNVESKSCCLNNNVVDIEPKSCCLNNNVVNVESKPCCLNNNVVNVESKPCCLNNKVVDVEPKSCCQNIEFNNHKNHRPCFNNNNQYHWYEYDYDLSCCTKEVECCSNPKGRKSRYFNCCDDKKYRCPIFSTIKYNNDIEEVFYSDEPIVSESVIERSKSFEYKTVDNDKFTILIIENVNLFREKEMIINTPEGKLFNIPKKLYNPYGLYTLSEEISRICQTDVCLYITDDDLLFAKVNNIFYYVDTYNDQIALKKVDECKVAELGLNLIRFGN